ncbi:hypothetical protein B0T14DRAFT_521428 [Immersiella caudata]|uniref:Uncharacterized protein n=1 Tax=Immersiella caudata TaxID=314043 RepID=A0AA39WRV4_9PEZI|nr:hypothetical protein B0T14DRAFT_521428 [Immersiella caudata]
MLLPFLGFLHRFLLLHSYRGGDTSPFNSDSTSPAFLNVLRKHTYSELFAHTLLHDFWQDGKASVALNQDHLQEHLQALQYISTNLNLL